jgi:hypothetical protein
MHNWNAAEYTQMGLVIGLSLLVSLVTLVWCAILIPRLKNKPDRLLVAIVGLLCFLHIFKLLQETGIWPMPIPPNLRSLSGFLVAVAFLAAVFLLGAYRAQHRRVEYRLRLAEANEVVPSASSRRSQPVLRSAD